MLEFCKGRRAANWPAYRLFGLTLVSNFSFSNLLAEGSGGGDVFFTCINEPPCSRWKKFDPVYISPSKNARGENTLQLYRQPEYEVLHFPGIADFYLGKTDILCHLLNPLRLYAIEILLLGTVLGYWLERLGISVLHASAVVVEERAVAFLGRNHAGKSSLAAEFMMRGHPLLTDDLLAVQNDGGVFLGRPGYPQMRMWPDQAEYFLGHCNDLQPVHPAHSKRRVPVGSEGLGLFCHSSRPMLRLYLLDRRDRTESGRIEINSVSGAEAIIEFVRYSFLARLMEAAGLQAGRLKKFARMAKSVPVRRIVYPKGLGRLFSVRKAILNDLLATPESTGLANPALASNNADEEQSRHRALVGLRNGL